MISTNFTKIIFFLFSVIILNLPTSTTLAATQSLDEATLSLPITTLADTTINLAQYTGKKPVYLKFWATWCKPCRKQMPHFQRVQQQYGKDIQLIAVNIDINDEIIHIRNTKNEFSLTMPIAIDASGKLAQAFNLVGTPMHVLIDINGNIVHKGHEASKKLDETIKMLATNNLTELPDISSLSTNEPAGSDGQIEIEKNKYTALFFVATWCDWYLKESRPIVSKNCSDAQYAINKVYRKFPQFNWVGIASRLWTEEKELEKYKLKYDIFHPLQIDVTNKLFFDYHVKNFPTLVLLKDGEEIDRISSFKDKKNLIDKLRRVISNVF